MAEFEIDTTLDKVSTGPNSALWCFPLGLLKRVEVVASQLAASQACEMWIDALKALGACEDKDRAESAPHKTFARTEIVGGGE